MFLTFPNKISKMKTQYLYYHRLKEKQKMVGMSGHHIGISWYYIQLSMLPATEGLAVSHK